MDDLTPRQEEILALIRSHLAENGAPPTRAEIAAAFGFSSPTAAEGHLRALERKGVIELTSTSRGIRLLEKAGLPIVGRVAAGSPILAEQNLLGHCPIDPSVFKPLAHYLLQVRGESMRDVGILDGDWIAVHRTSQVRTGQIVVARIDDEVTVKRIKLKGARTELLPENPDFQPIVVDLRRQAFAIEGLYVGLVRR